MTQECEEQLIQDTAWIRGKLETYFNQVAPTLATKESVNAVDKKIDDHVCGHKENKTSIPIWLTLIASTAFSVIAFFIKRS